MRVVRASLAVSVKKETVLRKMLSHMPEDVLNRGLMRLLIDC